MTRQMHDECRLRSNLIKSDFVERSFDMYGTRFRRLAPELLASIGSKRAWPTVAVGIVLYEMFCVFWSQIAFLCLCGCVVSCWLGLLPHSRFSRMVSFPLQAKAGPRRATCRGNRPHGLCREGHPHPKAAYSGHLGSSTPSLGIQVFNQEG